VNIGAGDCRALISPAARGARSSKPVTVGGALVVSTGDADKVAAGVAVGGLVETVAVGAGVSVLSGSPEDNPSVVAWVSVEVSVTVGVSLSVGVGDSVGIAKGVGLPGSRANRQAYTACIKMAALTFPMPFQADTRASACFLSGTAPIPPKSTISCGALAPDSRAAMFKAVEPGMITPKLYMPSPVA
jgi:hypothetical protein